MTRIKQTHAEWLEQGTALFGDKARFWVFVCPNCKTEQTGDDFSKYTTLEKEQITTKLGFSCIGRFTKEKGCDWTLGGFLRIHEKEITFPDGEVSPVFLFKDELVTSGGEG